MLRNRVVRVAGGDGRGALVARGCPQGGVLSPLLWNLVVNDLVTRLNSKYFYTVGYADDITILMTGRQASIVCDTTQAALKLVENWCVEHDLTVNPTKTEMVMFTNKRNVGNYNPPELFGSALQTSSEVKYLGLTLDSKLNWSSHIDQKTKKSSIVLWQCRKMVGKRWGLSPKIFKWLYTVVIRPMLSYGALVWWPRTNLGTCVKKLQSFQRLACCAITGCMRTTPTAAMEAMLNLPPLHLFIQQEAAQAALRLKFLKLNRFDKVKHFNSIFLDWNNTPLIDAPCDKVAPIHIFNKRFKIELSECGDPSRVHRSLRIFTDGSKTSAGTGTGVFSEDLNINIVKPLGSHSTVFQAECMGILLAAQAIATRKVTDHNIIILSDSKSVLQALDRTKVTSSLVVECQKAVNLVGIHNNITIQWIKGHSGDRGNDAADSLARRGSESKPVGPEPFLPLPQCWFKGRISERTYHLHQNYWNNHEECRQAKLALPQLNTRLSRALLQLSKPRLRLVTSAITGHGSFNKHLFNLGVTDSPLCRACMRAEETAAHVLLECGGMAECRANYLGSLGSLREEVGNVKALAGFLEDIGWLE